MQTKISKCSQCGETERLELLDQHLEDLGCEVTCKGCDTLICLECGADVENND